MKNLRHLSLQNIIIYLLKRNSTLLEMIFYKPCCNGIRFILLSILFLLGVLYFRLKSVREIHHEILWIQMWLFVSNE